MNTMQPRVEAEVRLQIDQRLQAKGWILDPSKPGQNVFLERAVIPRLSSTHRTRLDKGSPDYTFFSEDVPIAVLEAKKPKVSIKEALKQGCDYAEKIGCEIVFACNGPTFKTHHSQTGGPLYLNQTEVLEPLTPSTLREFRNEGTDNLITVPSQVIQSREQLIDIFEGLNNKLRSAGIRAGLDRFTEFANLLFLKLLSEKDSTSNLWSDLLHKDDRDLPAFLNDYVIEQLRGTYNSEVLSRTQISGKVLKAIIQELNPLRLSSVDEDIKGAAFEYFLQRTTGQNDLGEYFTPRHVVRFMVRLLNPEFGKNVFDPFCGTGGFLTETFRHLGNQATHSEASHDQLHHKSLYGREITKNARIAKMNMILFGDGHSGVVQGDSLTLPTHDKYDYVMSNIPFSLQLEEDVVTAVDPHAKDSDEACLLHCFNSLRLGGAMAIVVPEGLVVNQNHMGMWRRLCKESRIRLIASLPRGSFAPYTDAGTRILYLTDKNTEQTRWYYDVTLDQNHSDSIGMEEFQFFYQSSDNPYDHLPNGVDVVSIENLESESGFYIERPWKISNDIEVVRLEEVASIQNGTSITEATAIQGKFPVIAGGRGTIPYTHKEANQTGGCFTISKSGAYSGYVWWHENSIWASDCLAIRSLDEEVFLTFYLYMCMKTKQDEIYLRQQGTGQPHVYKKHISGFPIPRLSLEEQKKYVQNARLATSKRINAEQKEEEVLSETVAVLETMYKRKS